MIDLLVPGLSAASTLGGALLASATRPTACHWTSLDAMLLRQRLHMLKRRVPSRLRRIMAGLGLAGLMTSGALAAYATEPSAPEQLPGQVIGVVGSGDQLALQISTGSGVTTLRPGQTYADGWKLEALTPSSATLSRHGETRQVGLNPSGALDSKDTSPPTTVRLVGLPDQATIDRYYQRALDNGDTEPGATRGMTLDDTKRSIAYLELIWEEQRKTDGRQMTDSETCDFLGATACSDQHQLMLRARLGLASQQLDDLMAYRGPTSFYVPAGVATDTVMREMAREQGFAHLPGGWDQGKPDAQGGTIYTQQAPAILESITREEIVQTQAKLDQLPPQ